MSATIWKEKLPAPPLHSWFEAFEADAPAALNDLLLGRFDLANLSVTEPRSLISEWIVRVGNAAGFSSRLDTALTGWIQTQWGNFDLASRSQLLSVWETVAHVLNATYRSGPSAAPLEKSAESLRDRIADASGFSAQLFSTRGTDAFLACLNVVALYQRDDSLRALWWRLAELPDGFPLRYASVALTGIRRLPAVSGGFRYDVATALFTVARAISCRVQDGDCSEQIAVEEFQLLYQRTRRQFPAMDQRWAEVFLKKMQAHNREAYSDAIWRFLDGEQGRLPRPQSTGSHSRQTFGNNREPAPLPYNGLEITWEPQQPRLIESAIARREFRAVENAEAFLDQQRSYARKTGLTLNLVQSLHLFASRIRNYDLNQAEIWVREELDWEPNNARSWSLLVDVLRRDHPNRAWRIAWAVKDRFPFDPYVHTELAEVLKEQGRLAEAEEVYRQTLEDFPGSIVAGSGLAEVLKLERGLAECELVYRQTLADCPDDIVICTGLADVLRLRVKLNEVSPNPALDEAEHLYGKVLALAPSNRLAVNGLKKIGRLKAPISSATPASVDDSAAEGDDDALTSQQAAPWGKTIDDDANRVAEEPIPAQAVIGHPVSHVPKLNETGYRLRLARAAFLRRSARRQAALPAAKRSIAPERLRDGAHKLLELILQSRPNDSRTRAELAALAMDEGATLTGLTGDSVAILTVVAQAARLKAKVEGYQLNNSTQRDEVLNPIRRLRSVNRTITQLVQLQDGLAHIAMLDGEARLDAIAASFTRLRNWIRPHEVDARASIADALEHQSSPAFTAPMWWSHALTKQLFEPSSIEVISQTPLLHADARHLSDRVEKVAPIISELEFSYARHLNSPVEDLISEAS